MHVQLRVEGEMEVRRGSSMRSGVRCRVVGADDASAELEVGGSRVKLAGAQVSAVGELSVAVSEGGLASGQRAVFECDSAEQQRRWVVGLSRYARMPAQH
jgi:hypothetical protein